MARDTVDPGLSDGVVVLRPWRVEDAGFYVDCCNDPQTRRFTTDHEGLTEDEVRAAIEELAHQPNRTAYLIADALTGERLGNIAADWDGDVVDLAYIVAASARGRGVASRALVLLSAIAAADPRTSRLRLWTHEANVASRRVAERAGFARDADADCLRQIKGAWWPTVGFTRDLRGPSR